jgi:hypothetical protein
MLHTRRENGLIWRKGFLSGWTYAAIESRLYCCNKHGHTDRIDLLPTMQPPAYCGDHHYYQLTQVHVYSTVTAALTDLLHTWMY